MTITSPAAIGDLIGIPVTQHTFTIEGGQIRLRFEDVAAMRPGTVLPMVVLAKVDRAVLRDGRDDDMHRENVIVLTEAFAPSGDLAQQLTDLINDAVYGTVNRFFESMAEPDDGTGRTIEIDARDGEERDEPEISNGTIVGNISAGRMSSEFVRAPHDSATITAGGEADRLTVESAAPEPPVEPERRPQERYGSPEVSVTRRRDDDDVLPPVAAPAGADEVIVSRRIGGGDPELKKFLDSDR